MQVEVRLFGMMRERAGRNRLTLELDEEATVADALEELTSMHGLGELIARLPVRMAVNREYASEQTRLRPQDEIALVPPVSGGSDVWARITSEPLVLEPLARGVSRPGAGAIVTFSGATRAVEALDYEAYAEMAEERMRTILAECRELHGLEAVAAEHRVGLVPLGEASVIVAVSAVHRTEAFAGAREAIDRIKSEAPIWKREIDAGTARWVEGTMPER
jgi:molybdopterin converting factor subunit 1